MVLGLSVPALAAFLNPFILFFVALVLFLNFLGLEFAKIVDEFRHWREQIHLLVITMIVVPVCVYGIARVLFDVFGMDSRWALGVMLVFAAPTAALAPTLARLLKLNSERTVVNVALTTLSVPLTLPILFRWVYGTMVVSPWLLCAMIGVPAIAAALARKQFGKVDLGMWPPVALICLVIVGSMEGLWSVVQDHRTESLLILTILFISYAAAFLVGWLLFPSDRLNGAVMSTWTNSSLSLGLATAYFKSSMPMIVLVVVLSEFPWSGLLGLLRLRNR